MDGRNVVDLSSFLLFEAIGDSEADSELNVAAMNVEEDLVINDDDDAQSCSCDSSDCARVIEFDDEFDDDNLCYEHNSDCYDDDDDDGEEAIEKQDWNGDSKFVLKEGLQKKSRTCVESTMEVINEMDRNRLFWEACLAS